MVKDTIYLIGGMHSYNSPPISTLMAYHPLTDTWEEEAPMPTARGMLSACAVGGKIYAIGGTTAKPRNPPIDQVSAGDSSFLLTGPLTDLHNVG